TSTAVGTVTTTAANEHQLRNKLALTAIVRAAQNRDTEADKALQDLLPLVSHLKPDATPLVRWPELIAAAATFERPALAKSATALLEYMVIEQIQKKAVGPHWDVQARHYLALAQYKQLPGTANRAFGTEPALTQWTRVTHSTAASLAAGDPLPHWQLSPGQLRHFPGHSLDAMYFRVPLRGNFEVNCECGWREIRLAYAGQWIGPKVNKKNYTHDTFAGPQPDGAIEPPPVATGDNWYKLRLAVQDGVLTLFANDVKFHEQRLPAEPDPWLAIVAPG